jgi:hypothetical protein
VIFPDESRLPPPYMEPRQAQRREPTDYENKLGDAIEAAFAGGAWEPAALVERLNASGIRTPDGSKWTVTNFRDVIDELNRD